ncbi:MAG: L-2-amino-thiazoline-4-carboxylic acid hydrolase [Candidatus Thorarchaeota archaeon]
MSDTISKPECTHQVRQMGRMFGLLYYHFAKTIVQELGEVEGKNLIQKAIHQYGIDRGNQIRQIVEKKGLELSFENLARHIDLPSLGWESNEEGTTYCCYAQVWLEKSAEDLGILYCDVDYAVIEGYNPKIKLERLKNVLQGNNLCKYTVENEGEQ